MDISNAEVRNLLCDQTINIYLLVKDFNVIKNSNKVGISLDKIMIENNL